MRDGHENTLLQMIREHNALNGFSFVIAEFSVVALAALFICASGILHGRWPVAFAGAGIAANAIAVIAIAVIRIRNREQSQGLLKFRSAQFRADIGQKHPKLSSHTTVLLVSILIPLLLVALLYVQRPRPVPKKPM
jgi:sugar phosphate permease